MRLMLAGILGMGLLGGCVSNAPSGGGQPAPVPGQAMPPVETPAALPSNPAQAAAYDDYFKQDTSMQEACKDGMIGKCP